MNDLMTHSVEATRAFGRRLGMLLPEGTVVCLHGDLGAGKTQLVKGIVAGATAGDEEDVNSPTFVYLNIYPGKRPVYHFDLYRLNDSEDFLSMGFDEYLQSNGICCVEWPRRIEELLPSSALHIMLEHAQKTQRRLSFRSTNEALLRLVQGEFYG